MAAIKKVVAKKPLVKKQAGGLKKPTPFKDYLKNNKGAVPSDTVATSTWDRRRDKESIKRNGPDSGQLDIKAKNPKNQKALEKAYEKTYGQDVKTRISNPSKGETHDQYNRRMGYKKGGAVKPLAKKQTGGSSSPQTMKEYVKKYKKSGSVTYGMHDINPTSATDTLYEQGPYRRFLSEDPKKKQQVEDLIRVHDNKFYPNGKLTTNPKDRKEVLDAGKRKKGGVVRKAVVKKKK